MPPKKPAAKKGAKAKAVAPPIEKPVVTKAEYDAASKILQDEAEMKRQRSSLSFFLEQKGQKEEFTNWKNPAKLEFLTMHLADKLKSGNLRGTLKTLRKVEHVSRADDWHEWWNKQQMIDRWGTEKAEAKIKSGKLESRGDELTGEEGEWLSEYKIFFKKVGTESLDRNINEIDIPKDLDSAEAKASALTFLDDTANGLLGSTSSSSRPSEAAEVPIKTEGDEKPTAPKPLPPGSETMEALKENPRKVLRSCGDTITELKTMYENTADNRFLEVLHAEVHKIIPKFSSIYKSLEGIAVKRDKDEVTMLALAAKLDSHYVAYNEVASVYDKMVPKDKKAKKPKVTE